MPNFSLGGWIFLTVTLAAVIGVLAWMVDAGFLAGSILATALSVILTAITGVVFHNAGASAALATPAAPATPTVTPVAAAPVPSAIPVTPAATAA